MKTLHFLYFFFCCFSIAYLSCDNTEYSHHVNSTQEIEPRIPDCEECPIEDCCCGVQLLNSGTYTMQFCGSTSPDNTDFTCGPTTVGSCTIEGFILQLGLSGSGDKELFCMTPNTAFRISSSAAGTFRISCQNGIPGAQYQDITLSAGTPQYFEVTDECEVIPCN